MVAVLEDQNPFAFDIVITDHDDEALAEGKTLADHLVADGMWLRIEYPPESGQGRDEGS
jgi:hypothetical protein